MDKNNKWPKPKRTKTSDGTIAYYWDNKLHNWEGPALIPEGNNKLREYYIYGIRKTEEEWILVMILSYIVNLKIKAYH